MDDAEVLRQNVRLRLAHLDTNMTKLAEASGVSRSRMSLWISGNPTLLTLGRIASILGVPTWALLCPEFDPREYPPPEPQDGDGDDREEESGDGGEEREPAHTD